MSQSMTQKYFENESFIAQVQEKSGQNEKELMLKLKSTSEALI